jgi:hypothetical protein
VVGNITLPYPYRPLNQGVLAAGYVLDKHAQRVVGP